MIDLSSLAAPMSAPPTPESFAHSGGEPTLLGSQSGASGEGTTSIAGRANPSAEGFLEVLELFLGSSPLPSGLLTSTAITQSGNPAESTYSFPPETKPSISRTEETSEPVDLDVGTSERIASLLQMLGFQVKPTEIQQLSPLDRQQLGNALEFVQRNLERGAVPSQVAENLSMLLPRPWPLDDADGSPVGTSEASTATEGDRQLPTDLVSSIEPLRKAIKTSLGQPEAGSDSMESAIASVPVTDPTKAKSIVAYQTVPWNEIAELATTAQAQDTSTVPRHIPPGGTTSELIGRQVLEKVHLQLSEGHREIKLRLWPEELGEVRLSLKMNDNDKVHANMVVENDAVRQAILDASPQLKESLARHGLDLERLSVSVSQKDARDAGGEDQGEQGRRGSRRSGNGGGWNEAQILVPEAIAMGEDTGMRNGRNTIDLWS